MLVFGTDPGTAATGFAVVGRQGGRYHLVDAGILRTSTEAPMEQRLAHIHAGLCERLAAHRPDAFAIEKIFAHKSSTSAIVLGQARGVALLAAAQAGLVVAEYNPMTIKQSVGGHGRATKAELGRLVAMLLGLSKPLPSDAADAAAIAITHLAHGAAYSRLVVQ